MKKLTALFLALCLLCSLAGCSGRNIVSWPEEDSSSSSTARPEPPRASSVPEPEEDEPEDAGNAAQMEDLLGFWEGNVYSNRALGICFTLPEGWEHSSDEELLEMVDLVTGNEFLSDRAKMAAELGKSRMFYGLFAGDPISGSNVQLMFLKMGGLSAAGGSVSEEECARQMVAQQELVYDESSGVTLNFGDTYRAPLGGVNFLVLPAEIDVSGAGARQWYYIHIVDDYGAVIVITAMADQDIETMTGGASAFAPLGSVSGSTGASGVLTATGDIGRTFSTMFFDYTVVSAGSPAEYDGYTAQDGNKLLVVRVRVKNDFGSTLPMYDTDFPLFWGNDDNEYSWAVDAFNDDMMPLEWELEDGEEATWDMLFEVPADRMDFSLSYLEEYTDRFGKEQTGEWYDAQISLPVSSAA